MNLKLYTQPNRCVDFILMFPNIKTRKYRVSTDVVEVNLNNLLSNSVETTNFFTNTYMLIIKV